MLCHCNTLLAQLQDKVAKLSSTAASVHTKTKELDDAWQRINHLCQERGAQEASMRALKRDGAESALLVDQLRAELCSEHQRYTQKILPTTKKRSYRWW